MYSSICNPRSRVRTREGFDGFMESYCITWWITCIRTSVVNDTSSKNARSTGRASSRGIHPPHAVLLFRRADPPASARKLRWLLRREQPGTGPSFSIHIKYTKYIQIKRTNCSNGLSSKKQEENGEIACLKRRGRSPQIPREATPEIWPRGEKTSILTTRNPDTSPPPTSLIHTTYELYLNNLLYQNKSIHFFPCSRKKEQKAWQAFGVRK